MYDTIIIGSGPAGITAAIYAIRREMKVLVVGKDMGGQVVWASEIENYPGMEKVDNIEFISRFKKHAEALGVEIKTAEIQKIQKKEDGTFKLFTGREELETRTIIIAMGLSPRRLAIPGEKEFNGRGVSYCANCDGPMYKDKIVAVVGGGNSALDAAEVLSKIGKQVYLVHRRQEFRAFDMLVKEVKERENIELVLDSEIKEIVGPSTSSGQAKVNKIKVLNNKTNQEREIELDGVFIEVGRIAHTDLVADLVERNEKSEIITDELGKTSCPGIFAAGDVTPIIFKQITIACGQGTIAALSAYQYLQLKEGKDVVPILDRSKPKS